MAGFLVYFNRFKTAGQTEQHFIEIIEIMALVGWKTEYEKRLSAEGMNHWEIFSIAEQACKDLEWEYLVADEKTFTATTPTHWTLS